ncbi:MAG: lantibiotic immunity ABC transporter MutG family permease subunit [Lachnospiraceae bacterium]|nr:lantibiotic immunity ABC transporter MutG family permease subunit [Lachnospiraceae bacterium]
MCTLLRYMKSDYIKTKRTPLRIAHLIVPCVMAAVFLVYYAVTPWNAYGKVQAYFEIMGMGYPFLIGTFCAIVAEQESYAGAYQAMLSVTNRKMAFMSKLFLLILFGAFSVVLASVLFGTGYYFVLKQHIVSYSFYWIAAFVMLGGNIFLYIWHMFLALRFNKGISIGLGIAESLLAAVLLTGLGDSVWIFIPAAWASRLVCSMMTAYSLEEVPFIDCSKGIGICAAVTATVLIAYGIWCCHWEGGKGND